MAGIGMTDGDLITNLLNYRKKLDDRAGSLTNDEIKRHTNVNDAINVLREPYASPERKQKAREYAHLLGISDC
jgi:hypothetical protein